MPFKVQHLKMLSTVNCTECLALLNVYSDDQRTIDRSINKFQESHKCDESKRSTAS